MRSWPVRETALAVVALLFLLIVADGRPAPGTVPDEAMKVGRTVDSLGSQAETYLKDMDPDIKLTPEEAMGRDTWVVWTGGNDRFWDKLAQEYTFGSFDLLK